MSGRRRDDDRDRRPARRSPPPRRRDSRSRSPRRDGRRHDRDDDRRRDERDRERDRRGDDRDRRGGDRERDRNRERDRDTRDRDHDRDRDRDRRLKDRSPPRSERAREPPPPPRRDDSASTSNGKPGRPRAADLIGDDNAYSPAPGSDVRMDGAEEGEDAPDEDAQMMAMMGFAGFDTTKGKPVEGNQEGAVDIKKRRTWRQYMNRRGGFNRPLDKIK